jgi:hypothetical protein
MVGKVVVEKRERRLVKHHMVRDEDAVSGKVTTPIPLMIGRIA